MPNSTYMTWRGTVTSIKKKKKTEKKNNKKKGSAVRLVLWAHVNI